MRVEEGGVRDGSGGGRDEGWEWRREGGMRGGSGGGREG